MLAKKIWNVFDAYGYMNDKLVFVHENLTSASIAGACQEATIKNGRGNSLYSSLEYDKEITVELGSNVLDIDTLASQCGSAIVEGATKAHTEAKTYEIDSEKVITIPQTPIAGVKLQIIDIATDKLVDTSKYTVSAKTVTFTDSTIKKVRVMPYEYMAITAETIIIAADKFSEGMKLVMRTVEFNELQQVTAEIEVVFEKIKPSSSFSISTASEVSNGNDNTLSLKALRDDEGNLGRIVRIPVAKQSLEA